MNFLFHADSKKRNETLSSSHVSSDGITILSSSSSLSSASYTTTEQSDSNGSSSTDSSSTSKGTVSISDDGSVQSLECDDTVAETVASWNWSEVGPDDIEECFNPLKIFQFCSFCFGPRMQGLDSLRRKDCFVAIARSQLDAFDTQTKKNEPIIFDPLAACKSYRSNHNGANHISSITSLRYTPATIDSRASFMGSTKNGGMSSTTNHRRADVSVGFFTFATLEAIHSYDPDETEDLVTPRSMSNKSEKSATDNKRTPYKTPAARPRFDSEIFRSAIGEVTCEKRANSDDDDVSPIESLCGFSLLMNAEGRRSELSTQSKSPLGNAVQKRLVYDGDAQQRDDSDETNLPKDLAAQREVPIRPKLFDTIQSLVPRPPTKVSHGSPNRAKDPAVPKPQLITRDGTTGTASSRQHLYLQKSVSFIKALRKSGRTGKCLIQGWVAYRNAVSWKEVSLCTRRCDFRYIVLLDDLPTLHIFSSKPKQKRGAPKPNILDNCISLDLTKDIEVGVSLASAEFGHEVYMVESESNQAICSMLPVAMKSRVFLNKHKSRLAKGDVLESVFQRSKPKEDIAFQKVKPSAKVTFQDNGDRLCPKISNQTHASIEQNDAAIHLLFVLSAAITFPPPRKE